MAEDVERLLSVAEFDALPVRIRKAYRRYNEAKGLPERHAPSLEGTVRFSADPFKLETGGRDADRCP